MKYETTLVVNWDYKLNSLDWMLLNKGIINHFIYLPHIDSDEVKQFSEFGLMKRVASWGTEMKSLKHLQLTIKHSLYQADTRVILTSSCD